ncbi:hypothetical protein ACXM0N_09760 [Peribacillus simplex]
MSIILIGPRGVGKSNVAKILSEKLNKNVVSLDTVRRFKSLDPIFQEGGLQPLSEEGHAYIVKHVIQHGNNDCILDFGCYHSVFHNGSIFSEMQDLLHPFQNIFLLIPSNNVDENESILSEMNSKMLEESSLSTVNNSNKRILESPCNRLLAKHTIYTKNLSFNEIADEIIEQLN